MTILEHPSAERPTEHPRTPRSSRLDRRSMRITHVVSSLQVGGMEQFVLRIAEEQQRRGHPVTVIGLQGGPLLEQAHRLGLDARALGGSRTLPRLLRATACLARLRPAVVNAHNPRSLPYALLARLVCRSRVVLVRHGQEAKPISALQWRSMDAVVAVSEAAAQALRRNGAAASEKIAVIHNGVRLADPLQGRKQIRRDLGLVDEVVAIIVARIDRLKGHEYLLRALAQVRDAGTALTLLVAGDGAERANMERLAGELQLGAGHVRFLGFRADVTELLAASDFFVLPSLTEGLPLCVLEAMAHRLPVVATPVGGIPELVTDGVHGRLVPVQDVEALASAMTELATDAGRRHTLGEAAYATVREHFSFEAMADKYEQLYQRLGCGWHWAAQTRPVRPSETP
jgi:glycosyltransferase involved in cell wall biosynthesis